MANGAVRRTLRNPLIARGVRRFGRAAMSHKTAKFKFSKLGLNKKQKAHVAPQRKAAATGSRFYAADRVLVPLRSHRAAPKAAKLRKSITPGTVAIVLAGRFRGARVVVLKQLASGLLLVSGPYKVNGVPLRRINQAYVIATSTKVDVSKVDVSKIDDAFFARPAEKKAKKEFFDKDAKNTVVTDARKKAQAAVDAPLLAAVKAVPHLNKYLAARFTLTRGQKPHLLKF